MKREVYSVFKHESFNGVKWAVQMPRGILGFRLKREAQGLSNALKQIAERDVSMAYVAGKACGVRNA